MKGFIRGILLAVVLALPIHGCMGEMVAISELANQENLNSIVANWFYSVAGRGNTNHYDYDGVANVTLHGNMYINAE